MLSNECHNLHAHCSHLIISNQPISVDNDFHNWYWDLCLLVTLFPLMRIYNLVIVFIYFLITSLWLVPKIISDYMTLCLIFFFQYITFTIKIKPTQITSDSNRPHPILSLYITRYNICFSEAMQFTMGRCFLFIFWLE